MVVSSNIMVVALLPLSIFSVMLETGQTTQSIRTVYLHEIHSTGLRTPYKTTATKSCWSSRSCDIQGSIVCVNDPECLSYTKIGEEFHFFRNNQCDGGSVGLLTRCSCEQNRTYTRGVDICYKVYNTPREWTEAESICSNDGGRLLVLDNDDKLFWFIDQFEFQDTFWIGARWIGGKMKWLNGKELPLDKFWHANEPANPVDSSVAMWFWKNRHGLDDQGVDSNHYFICEY